MFRLKFSKTHRLILIAAIIFVAIFVFTYRNFFLPKNLSQQTIEETIINTGSNNDTRPAIANPNFESAPLADTYLQDEGQGITLVKNGKARFYPFQILVWHNLVNDIWNGFPVLVVYDPLCGSSAVFERDTKDAAVLSFKNSGKIYNNMMLFSDEGTDSLWGSLNGRALSGSKVGETLTALPSYVMTWQSFKENFPNGYVLSRETGVARDYSHNPYGNYAETSAVWYPLTKYDSTYSAKTIVYGYESEVFPLDNIKSSGIVRGSEVDFIWDEELETVEGYDENENEVALTPAYWFCWAANH